MTSDVRLLVRDVRRKFFFIFDPRAAQARGLAQGRTARRVHLGMRPLTEEETKTFFEKLAK